MTSIGLLRQTLVSLAVTHSNITTVSGVLLCDTVHDASATTSDTSDLSALARKPSLVWRHLRWLDLSHNRLVGVDESMRLVPSLTSLDIR